MSYRSRPQLVSRSKRANIGQKFKPLHEFRVQESSERLTTRTSNRLGEVQICCTRDADELWRHQLCYNYVCLFDSRRQLTFRCRILELSAEFLSTIYCSQATG